MQFAKAMETDEHMQKFCLDIARKAKFLHDLKPHLFYEMDTKQHIEGKISFYEKNKEYNTREHGTE